jgi:molecular chaperone GrpE (heat shock protein)
MGHDNSSYSDPLTGQCRPNTVAGIIPALLEAWQRQDRDAQLQREELQRQLQRLDNAVEHLNVLLQQIPASFQSVTQHQQQLTEYHYQQHIIMPLVYRVQCLYDLAVEGIAQVHRVGDEPGTDRAEFMEAARSQVVELLSTYGVDILDAPEGAPFDSKTMRVMNTIVADPSGRSAWLVSKTIRVGFRHGNRILRPQYVDVDVLPLDQHEPS